MQQCKKTNHHLVQHTSRQWLDCLKKQNKLNVIPRQMEIKEYYTRTHICKSCEEQAEYTGFYLVETVPPLPKHSLASSSSAANVMTHKYEAGIPLYQQDQIWKRDEIELSRVTLANWVIQGANWLKPLVRRMKVRKMKLPEYGVIHADETVVRVYKEGGKSNASEIQM